MMNKIFLTVSIILFPNTQLYHNLPLDMVMIMQEIVY